MHNIQNLFATHIKGLITLNHLFREQELAKANKLALDPIIYAMEFCTIGLTLPRRAGKTSFIFNEASDTDLIVSHNVDYNIAINIMSIYGLMQTKLTRSYETIWIDDPKFIFTDAWTKLDLYKKLVDPKIEQTFIILGT